MKTLSVITPQPSVIAIAEIVLRLKTRAENIYHLGISNRTT